MIESESGNDSDHDITLHTINVRLVTIDHKVSNLYRLLNILVGRNNDNRDLAINPEPVPEVCEDNIPPMPRIHVSADTTANLNRSTKSPPQFAKQLICQLMSDAELARCNCKGKKVKNSQRGDVEAIPDEIMKYVVETTFLNKGITEDQKQGVEKIVQAIDMHCRRKDNERRALELA